MPIPNVTIIMSPREGFNDQPRAIEALYDTAGVPFDFVCVDAGSPPVIKNYLQAAAARRGFKLIRIDHYLTENEARNRGLGDIDAIKTPYVVFIDNDVIGTPGWVGDLIRCAEETGAAVVSPLLCLGEPLHTIVHVGGGEVSINVENGKRIFRETHRFSEVPLADVREQLVREPTKIAEFHCMLVKTEWLRRLGHFDENLTTTSEHNDFCLAVQERGGVIMLEPRAIATQTFGHPLLLNEVGYFFFRWDQKLSMASERYFHKKWNTVFDDEVIRNFIWWRRRHALPRTREALRFFFGYRLSEWMFERIAAAFVWRIMRRRAVANRQNPRPPLMGPRESAPEQRRAA